MIDYKNQTLIWGSSFVLIAAQLTTVFNATNPDYNFPGITEILLIGVSFLIVANSQFAGRSLTRREWIISGILLFLICILAIRYLIGWNDTETIPSRRCIWMPGYFAKLECFLQLPFKSHHGLRQLLFHFTALSVFIGAACLSRMSGVSRQWLIIPLVIPALIVAIGEIITIYYDNRFSLTGYNFIYNTTGTLVRAKGVVANPSWFWPWLTPVMAISAATLFAKNWILKVISLGLFCIFTWVSISVMQRGGYLIVGVLLTAFILTKIYLFIARFSKKNTFLLGTIGTLGIFFLVFDKSRLMGIFNFLRTLGVPIREDTFQVSIQRLRMWTVAWNESIHENIWLGTGYGTWLREFSKLRGSQDLSYDTAHNLWVQLIFELGVFHFVFMVIMLGLIVFTTLIYKNFDQPSLKMGGLFLTIGFFVTSIVQEIDYILPVYIQFAVFAGLIFGGTSYKESLLELSSSNQIGISNNNCSRKLKTKNLAWCMVGVGSLGILGAFYYASSISWGGSTFEPTQQAFNRWYRPKGVIAAAPDSRRREYSIFWSEHGQFEKKKFVTFKDFPEVWIQGNAIFLKNGSILKPNQFSYESQNKIYDAQRLISFALHQPHGQTNSIMLAENGMYSWEFGGIGEEGVKVGRWCKKECNFLLYYPNIKNQPNGFWLQMPLPGLDENHPVHLLIKMQSITDNITSTFAEINIQQMLKKPFAKDFAKKEFFFSSPEDIHRMPIELGANQLWLISLKTDRTIIPKEHDHNSTDGRELGIRVLF